MIDEILPDGWIETKCSEFCSGRNRTFNPSTAKEKSYILYSVPSHATGEPETVTPKEIGSSKQHVSPGDTLISKINPRLNRTWVVGEHANRTIIASTEWIVFAASESFIPKFLAMFLQQAKIRDFLSHNASGVGGSLIRIKPAIFDQVPLPLPPLAEQKRIVAKIEELFSELDAGEESLRRARRQLGVYRQSLLKQAFEGKLTAPWRQQNPHLLESPDQLLKRIQEARQARYEMLLEASEIRGLPYKKRSKPKKPEMIKLLADSELAIPRELPFGWIWIAVADIGRIETGTTPPTNNPSNYGGTIPFFKPTDLEQGAIVRDAREHLTASGGKSARLLPAGTTLVTCIGATIGKAGMAVVDCATNQQINTISPEKCFEPLYVYYAVIAPRLNGLVKSEASATTLPILNKSKFEALPFPVCSLPEQQEIIRLLDEQFTVIAQNEQEIDAALKRSAALRQSILKKAFTGHLVPQDPTDEPASTLLDMIQKERESQEQSVHRKKKSLKII